MKYKIGQISDAHLGYSSGQKTTKDGVNLRVIDGYNAFHEAIDGMLKEKIDVAIIPGDIFHTANPDVRTIIETQKGLRKLTAANIPIYCIAGNHDATDIRSDIPSNGVLDDQDHNIFSFTEPYVVKEIFPNVFFHFLSHHAYTDQEETMKNIKPKKDSINILVSHGSCFDTNMNVMLHCPQEPREVIIPEYLMELDWDYTLLGHIHERGWIASKDGVTDTANRKQFYGGSLVRRGFADKPCKLNRGWTLWTLDDETKNMTPTFFDVKQRPQIDCDKINAENRTSAEIEMELYEQLEKIFNEYKNSDNTIDSDLAPIVRQNVINISPVTYATLNLKNNATFTKHFLTYTLKVVSKNNILIDDSNQEQTAGKNESNKNIVDLFNDWIDDVHKEDNSIDNLDKVKEKSKILLQKGENEVLDEEK